MVESIGICEKHLLPLDEKGECELCRLSDMPSKAPPTGSAWWAVVIPVAIVLLGAAVTYFAVLSGDGAPAPRGVPPAAPAVAAPEPASAEPEEPTPEPEEATPGPEELAPERVPTRPFAPSPEDIPTPADFEP